MSDFIGIIGTNIEKQSLLKNIAKEYGTKVLIKEEYLLIYYKKHPDTFKKEKNKYLFGTLLISDPKNTCYQIPSNINLQNIIYGQYAFLEHIKEKKEISISIDKLGIKDIFYIKKDSFVIFSTRLDWISHLIEFVPNFHYISGAFSFPASFSHATEITNISRIFPSKKIRITDTGKIYLYKNTSTKEETTNINIKEEIKKTIYVCHPDKTGIILGLSAGIDSRILFAILNESRKKDFTVVSFGNAQDPDIHYAQYLSSTFGIKHTIYNQPIKSNIHSLIKDYLFVNTLNKNFSRLPYMYFYEKLDMHDNIYIDGGQGEIIRQSLYKRYQIYYTMFRFLFFNMKKIFFHLLKHTIPDFFSDEIKETMESFSYEQFSNMIKLYQKEKKRLNLKSFLSLYFHLPNLMAKDQRRLDRYGIFIMPYLSYKTINTSVYGKEVLNKNTINQKYWELPLYTHGYIIKNGKKEKFSMQNFYREQFFNISREWILDYLFSSALKNSPYFNKHKIEEISINFYKKDYNKINNLESLISFSVLFGLIK